MLALPYDLQNIILEFQEPKEIISLCESSTIVMKSFKEMMEETNFIVECKVIISDEDVEWFETNNIKLNLLKEYKVDNNGNQYWYKNGKLHRDNDLPAEIYSNDDREWYQNGKLHRDNDNPAVIRCLNRHREWYQNGKLHREKDMPAVIFLNGDQMWYKNGLRHRDNNLPWYQNGV